MATYTKPERHDASFHDTGYRPYLIDWRFLPENLLFLKDFIRHYVVSIIIEWGLSGRLRPLWMVLIGRSTLKAIRQAGVLFVHIPKTGGTSISKCIYGRNLPHFSAAFYDRVFGSALKDVPRFSVMREPVDRFISAYQFLMAGGTDIMLISRMEMAEFRGISSIEEFVDHIVSNNHLLRTCPLLMPQSFYILDDKDDVIVDKVFRFSKTGNISASLHRWLCIDSMPHINISKKRDIALSDEYRSMIADLYHHDVILYDRLFGA